jgi:hypothetical protein
MKGFDRWTGWWVAAEQAASRLTQPRADVRQVDADVEQLVRDASVMRVGGRLAAATARAWSTSRMARCLQAAACVFTPKARAVRLQICGFATVVAALTAAGLQTIGTAPRPLLGLMLPALAAFAGAIAYLTAAHLARAWNDKSS